MDIHHSLDYLDNNRSSNSLDIHRSSIHRSTNSMDIHCSSDSVDIRNSNLKLNRTMARVIRLINLLTSRLNVHWRFVYKILLFNYNVKQILADLLKIILYRMIPIKRDGSPKIFFNFFQFKETVRNIPNKP